MKICQINSVFAQGSSGKIVQDIHNTLLKKGYDSFVIYGEQKGNPDFFQVYPSTKKITRRMSVLINRFIGFQYGGAYMQTKKIIKILKNIKPDVVHIHNINDGLVNIYKLLHFLAKKNIKTVITLHAEFMYTGNCGHSLECNKWKTGCGDCPTLFLATKSYVFDRSAESWRKMKKCFSLFKKENIAITSVSEWVNNRAIESPILNGLKPTVIFNGLNTDIFSPQPYDNIKKMYQIKNEIVLLHVTACFDTKEDSHKGGKYILELAEMLSNKNVKIIIAANYGVEQNMPTNIIFHGRTKTQIELAQLYSLADLTIISSKKETFSMPVAESLCCGTPIVGFEAGGPERIALAEYSKFVPYGNIEMLYNVVLDWMTKKRNNKNKFKQLPLIAKKVYSKEQMTENYINIYNNLTNQ